MGKPLILYTGGWTGVEMLGWGGYDHTEYEYEAFLDYNLDFLAYDPVEDRSAWYIQGQDARGSPWSS